MLKRNRKIFYELSTGNVIQIVDGDIVYGSILETTIEQAFTEYKALAERVRETVGFMDLEYDDRLQDFQTCNGVQVNLTTGELEFSYPDPQAPEEPPVYQKPLTEQLAEVRAEKDLLEQRLGQFNSDFVAFTEFYFIQNPGQA